MFSVILLDENRPFPSYLLPLCQNKSWSVFVQNVFTVAIHRVLIHMAHIAIHIHKSISWFSWLSYLQRFGSCLSEMDLLYKENFVISSTKLICHQSAKQWRNSRPKASTTLILVVFSHSWMIVYFWSYTPLFNNTANSF